MNMNEIILLDKDDYTQEPPKFINFSKMCRTCLRIDPDMTKTVHGNLLKMSFKTLLEEYALIKIPDEGDKLPQHLCSNCFKFLIEMHTFRSRCNVNEIQLKMVMKKHMIEANKAQTILQSIHTYAKVSFDDQNGQNSNSSNKTEEYNLECNENDDSQEVVKTLVEHEVPVPLGLNTDILQIRKFKKMAMKVSEEKLGIYRCQDCPEIFPTKALLAKHRAELKHYLEKTTKCPECEKFFTKNTLKKHMVVHTKEKSFQCTMCGLLLSTSSSLGRHIRLHSGLRSYKCEYCDKTFAQKTTLAVHQRVHAPGKIRKPRSFRSSVSTTKLCLICRHGFPNQETFMKHMKEKHAETDGESLLQQIKVISAGHQIEFEKENGNVVGVEQGEPMKGEEANGKQQKVFVCAEKGCQDVFEDDFLLKVHERRHKRMFFCGMCDKSFPQFPYLANHMWVHGAEKLYKCTICQKRFSHPSGLHIHMNIHNGIKRFACLLCNQHFRQQTHLTRHMRMHSGERPYQCDVCGQTFTFKGNLTVHKRRHTGETPFLCRVCNRGFYDSSNRKKHEQIQHSIEEISQLSEDVDQSVVLQSDEQVEEVFEGQQECEDDSKTFKYLIVDNFDDMQTVEWTIDCEDIV